MRLTQHEIKAINKTFIDVFEDGNIYLFGSRVDDTKKGGDIDLYIVLPYKLNAKEILEKKSEFKLQLYSLLGEQKIDIVISIDKSREIEKIAIRDGIMLNDKIIRVNKYLNECDKHTLRINKSFSKVKHIFPLSGSGYESLNDEEIAMIDQYLFRFSKLQDTLGEKLFRLIIEDFVENIDTLSFIDILNRLEKIGIIKNTNLWKKLRGLINDISHQYDDEPNEMAESINNIFAQKDILIEIYHNVKSYFIDK
jgi:predicted nucleotidyltransferase